MSKRWIPVAVDYFSRYIWTEATNRNDSDIAVSILQRKNFDTFGVPVGFYMDLSTHFGEKTRMFAESHGTVKCNSPVATKRTVGMVEKSVDRLQRILKKITSDPKQ